MVYNRTANKNAYPFRTTADGAWSGFIHLQTGENQIEITARAIDDTEASRTIMLDYQPDAISPAVPEYLEIRHNHLLKDCLAIQKEVSAQLEKERYNEILRQLKIEIERERVKARERVAAQSKMLEISVEEDEGDADGQAE